MPKVTLFEAGTTGVDLKTNPLFLGKKKLHAATNLAFEEGTLRTRPGFRYDSLGCSGIFQGAAEFHPKRGLSTAAFSEIDGGVVVAVSGKLYFNCKVVEGVEFPCFGNVNLFQAENYLIIQHEESETYWWDGVNLPVKSRGMQEQDFNDPEMPFVELENVAPVASIPICAGDSQSTGNGTDGACGRSISTTSVIGGGDVVILNTGTLPLTLTEFSIAGISQEYTFFTASEFEGALSLPITVSSGESITGSGIFLPESEPTFTGKTVCNGTESIFTGQILSIQDEVSPTYSYSITDIGSNIDSGNDDFSQGGFVLTNTGTGNLTINDISTFVDISAVRFIGLVDSALPATVLPGISAFFYLAETGDVGVDETDPNPSWAGEQFTITTSETAPSSHNWVALDSVDFNAWQDAHIPWES